MMNELLRDADLCVKCGLCLPHCPTYTQTQNENESPRGRIALIQAWAGQQLATLPSLLAHIDNCLLCRACERACPAVVPYGRLIDNFRQQTASEKKTNLSVTLIKQIAQNPTAKRWAQRSVRFYQSSPLQATARFLQAPQGLGLNAIERLLPEPSHSVTERLTVYPARIDKQGAVGLFVGCLGEWLDQDTVSAAITVLTAIGFDVHLPQQQTCCGALALHNGDANTAAAMAQTNRNAFNDVAVSAIISIASGCGSQLREAEDQTFAHKVMDISHFLHQHSQVLAKQLKPLPSRVCVHTPCSLKNVLRTEQSVFKLLQLIPELQLVPLPDALQCCGSAGSYSLDHPTMAQTLLSKVLDWALHTDPDLMVSSNIGCALHIAAGLRERKTALPVIHPVALLARQLSSGA